MSNVTEKTNRVTEAQDSLIDQFKDQTTIDAFVQAIVEQDQDLEASLFEVLNETTLANAVGQQLDNLGQVIGVEREGKTDADYRIRLAAKIALNIGSGTLPQIIDIIVNIVDDPANTIIAEENYPAEVSFETQEAITNGEEIAAIVQEAKPAGVGATFIWHESLNPFRFDTAGQGFDEGEMGNAL